MHIYLSIYHLALYLLSIYPSICLYFSIIYLPSLYFSIMYVCIHLYLYLSIYPLIIYIPYLSMYPSIHPFITFFYLAIICHHSYLSSTTYLLSIFYLSSIHHPSVYTSGLQPRGFCSQCLEAFGVSQMRGAGGDQGSCSTAHSAQHTPSPPTPELSNPECQLR